MSVDKFGRMSDAKTRDTGVSLTYINNNYIRSDGSALVSGSIDMIGNTLYNVADPVNPQDVATKEYADKVGDSPFFKENGNYQATHAINMKFKKLLNLQKPAEPYDAAAKDYVDYVNTTYRNIFSVYTNYHGKLLKDKFQFSFGGNDINSTSEAGGFLIPHSGRIKKIVIENFMYVAEAGFYKQKYVWSRTNKIFSVWLNPRSGSPKVITSYFCNLKKDPDGKICEFDRDIKNTLISEGDVLNIQTEVDTDLILNLFFTFLIE